MSHNRWLMVPFLCGFYSIDAEKSLVCSIGHLEWMRYSAYLLSSTSFIWATLFSHIITFSFGGSVLSINFNCCSIKTWTSLRIYVSQSLACGAVLITYQNMDIITYLRLTIVGWWCSTYFDSILSLILIIYSFDFGRSLDISSGIITSSRGWPLFLLLPK